MKRQCRKFDGCIFKLIDHATKNVLHKVRISKVNKYSSANELQTTSLVSEHSVNTGTNYEISYEGMDV